MPDEPVVLHEALSGVCDGVLSHPTQGGFPRSVARQAKRVPIVPIVSHTERYVFGKLSVKCFNADLFGTDNIPTVEVSSMGTWPRGGGDLHGRTRYVPNYTEGILLGKYPSEVLGKVRYGTLRSRVGTNSIPVPDNSGSLGCPPKTARVSASP